MHKEVSAYSVIIQWNTCILSHDQYVQLVFWKGICNTKQVAEVYSLLAKIATLLIISYNYLGEHWLIQFWNQMHPTHQAEILDILQYIKQDWWFKKK